jgi:hypothetical protein
VKYFYGSLLLLSLIFAVDLAWAHFAEWRKARKREREMARFSLNAFKAVSRNWWEA